MPNICDRCGVDIDALPMGSWPFCKGNQADHAPGNSNVIGDEIDVEIKHGLCNDDGTPKRYRSRTQLNKDAKAHGLLNYVVHQPPPGTDKSKHTSRWI